MIAFTDYNKLIEVVQELVRMRIKADMLSVRVYDSINLVAFDKLVPLIINAKVNNRYDVYVYEDNNGILYISVDTDNKEMEKIANEVYTDLVRYETGVEIKIYTDNSFSIVNKIKINDKAECSSNAAVALQKSLIVTEEITESNTDSLENIEKALYIARHKLREMLKAESEERVKIKVENLPHIEIICEIDKLPNMLFTHHAKDTSGLVTALRDNLVQVDPTTHNKMHGII